MSTYVIPEDSGAYSVQPMSGGKDVAVAIKTATEARAAAVAPVLRDILPLWATSSQRCTDSSVSMYKDVIPNLEKHFLLSHFFKVYL